MIGKFAAVRAEVAASQLAQRFLGGAAWSVLGAAASSGLTLGTWMIVARILGKEVYGKFVVIQSTLGMIAVLAGFGLGAAATRYVSELKTTDPRRLGNILFLAEGAIWCFGLLASAALIVNSDWIASNLLNAPELGAPLAIAAVALLFGALDSYQKSVLVGFEAMRAIAAGTIGGVLASTPIMIISAVYYGLSGATITLVIAAIVQAAISRYQMARYLKSVAIIPSRRRCVSEMPVLWKFALPALLAGALVGSAHWAAQAILANTKHGYADVAVLGIAMQWYNIILFIPTTVGRVILPILTQYVTTADYGRSRRILAYAICLNAVLAVPAALLVSAFSPYLLSLYGHGFEKHNLPIVIAALAGAMSAIASPLGNILAASSRMWLGVIMNAGWAAIYIGFTLLFIGMGAAGPIIALGVAYLAHTIWTLQVSRNALRPSQNALG